jgi:hypothetical protein
VALHPRLQGAENLNKVWINQENYSLIMSQKKEKEKHQVAQVRDQEDGMYLLQAISRSRESSHHLMMDQEIRKFPHQVINQNKGNSHHRVKNQGEENFHHLAKSKFKEINLYSAKKESSLPPQKLQESESSPLQLNKNQFPSQNLDLYLVIFHQANHHPLPEEGQTPRIPLKIKELDTNVEDLCHHLKVLP